MSDQEQTQSQDQSQQSEVIPPEPSAADGAGINLDPIGVRDLETQQPPPQIEPPSNEPPPPEQL